MLRSVALLAVSAEARCCFYPETSDRCSFCASYAADSNYCASGQTACEVDCDHVWCEDAQEEEPVTPGRWYTGTYTTGYWDCCKPSCSWPDKGDVDNPVRMCAAETGATLDDANTPSVCDGGTAASCADNQPFDVSDGLTMGFAAAAVGGISGLNGDSNCGQCFELVWTDETFDYGGGAHPSIVGNTHIIQVTNIGFDVSGDHAFDLQIPGAGQGLFDTGCAVQFPGFATGDFDCDTNYGGCSTVDGCDRLPDALRPGCQWRYSSSYMWMIDQGTSDNPYVRFQRVQCPDQLVAITGTRPNDDDDYPVADALQVGDDSAGVGTTTKKKTTSDDVRMIIVVCLILVVALIFCVVAALSLSREVKARRYADESSSWRGTPKGRRVVNVEPKDDAAQKPVGDDDL